MPKNNLTCQQKVHKWFRLVALLTLRKYGFLILGTLYYAFLLSAAVRAYDQVWTEYSTAQDCQSEFMANMSSMMSSTYDEASLALATSALDNTKCIMHNLDTPSPVPGIPLSDLPESVMLRLFGWISEPETGIVDSSVEINNTAHGVVDDMQNYRDKMSKVATYLDYAGYAVVAITILIILCTATHYTVRNKPWRPGKSRFAVILTDIVRAVVVYAFAMLVVYMQANSMDHACKIRTEDIQLLLPKCGIKAGTECGLSCVDEAHSYENACPKCDIPLQWWWVVWDSLPNVFGVLYILFLLVVYTLESVETRYQRRMAQRAQSRSADLRDPLLL